MFVNQKSKRSEEENSFMERMTIMRYYSFDISWHDIVRNIITVEVISVNEVVSSHLKLTKKVSSI